MHTHSLFVTHLRSQLIDLCNYLRVNAKFHFIKPAWIVFLNSFLELANQEPFVGKMSGKDSADEPICRRKKKLKVKYRQDVPVTVRYIQASRPNYKRLNI